MSRLPIGQTAPQYSHVRSSPSKRLLSKFWRLCLFSPCDDDSCARDQVEARGRVRRSQRAARPGRASGEGAGPHRRSGGGWATRLPPRDLPWPRGQDVSDRCAERLTFLADMVESLARLPNLGLQVVPQGRDRRLETMVLQALQCPARPLVGVDQRGLPQIQQNCLAVKWKNSIYLWIGILLYLKRR